MAPPPLAFSFPIKPGQSSASRRYAPGGLVDPAAVGIVLQGLGPQDVVQVNGYSQAVLPGDAVVVTPDRDARIAVISPDGVMRSVVVNLRRAPPRSLPVAMMPIVARENGGAIPSGAGARLEFVGFDEDALVLADGIPLNPVARDRAAGIVSYYVPPVSASLAVVSDGQVWLGSVGLVPGAIFDILPTDLSLATTRPWYLDESLRPFNTPRPGTTAGPQPSPSQSPAPTPPWTPAATAAGTPSPSGSPTSTLTVSPAPTEVVPSDQNALIRVSVDVPEATITLDGKAYAPNEFVPPGVYQMVVQAPGYQTEKAWVQAYAGDVSNVQVKMRKASPLRPLAIAGAVLLAMAGVGTLGWYIGRRRTGRAENPGYPDRPPRARFLVSWDAATPTGRAYQGFDNLAAARGEEGYRRRQGLFNVKMEKGDPRGSEGFEGEDAEYVPEQWDNLDELRRRGVGGLD
jgi:hypothetical protein